MAAVHDVLGFRHMDLPSAPAVKYYIEHSPARPCQAERSPTSLFRFYCVVCRSFMNCLSSNYCYKKKDNQKLQLPRQTIELRRNVELFLSDLQLLPIFVHLSGCLIISEMVNFKSRGISYLDSVRLQIVRSSASFSNKV